MFVHMCVCVHSSPLRQCGPAGHCHSLGRSQHDGEVSLELSQQQLLCTNSILYMYVCTHVAVNYVRGWGVKAFFFCTCSFLLLFLIFLIFLCIISRKMIL